MPDSTLALRQHLVDALSWEGAHVSFDRAVADFPEPLRGLRPEGLPYSAWELVEHLRLAQWDILDFCVNPDYVELDWPADYWPDTAAPPSESSWTRSLSHYRRDREAFGRLIADPDNDLFTPIPHGSGQSLLREAVLVIDHASYHVGQIILVRRLLGAWPA